MLFLCMEYSLHEKQLHVSSLTVQKMNLTALTRLTSASGHPKNRETLADEVQFVLNARGGQKSIHVKRVIEHYVGRLSQQMSDGTCTDKESSKTRRTQTMFTLLALLVRRLKKERSERQSFVLRRTRLSAQELAAQQIFLQQH